MQAHPGEHTVQSGDKTVKTDIFQKCSQMRFAQVVFEIIHIHAALKREGDKNKNRDDEHGDPGLVSKQITQVFLYTRLLFRIWNDTFFSCQKGDNKENNPCNGKQCHGIFKALDFVTIAKNKHQWQQQTLHDKLGNHHSHKAVARNTVALGHVAGQNATQRSIRQVVGRVDDHQQHVGDQRISDFPARAKIGCTKSQNGHDTKGNSRP